jgi:hypothetical protein
MQNRLRHSALGLGTAIVFMAAGNTTEFSDGTIRWRLIATDASHFSWEYSLTSTGFAGTENVDYYIPQSIDV